MTTRNGFDLDALREFLATIEDDARVAQLSIHTKHRWAGAAAIDGLTDQIQIAGEALPRRFSIRSDYPEPFGGRNTGPVPGELLLMALGACVAGNFAEKAALEGVDVAELGASLDTSIDLRGAYEVDGVRPGPSEITVTLRVRSEADDSVLEALGRAAVRTSPVADAIAQPVQIRLAVARAS